MKKLDINRVPVSTAILFIICIVVTAALAGTNFITKDKISVLAQNAEKEAMALVLPADSYKTDTVDIDGQKYEYHIAEKDGKVIGYLINSSEKGYGGDIKVMVGVDTLGKISGVKILAADDETPGLGANIKNKSFYGQYTGKLKDIVLQKNQADQSKNEIKAVTGATISSTAVNKAVNKAMDIAQKIISDSKENEEPIDKSTVKEEE